MSIFIKAGLWLEKKTGYKGEFNLTRYITDLIAATPPPTPTLPYKVYTALLTQTGENPPTAIVLENTLDFTPIWTRDNVGFYKTLGNFTQAKTTAFVSGNIYDCYSQLGLGGNQIILLTHELSTGGTLVDNKLLGTPIEIRVYN